MAKTRQTPIQKIAVAAYTIPTDQPESDGTLCWDSTTLITVRAKAADISGFGYTYAPNRQWPLDQDHAGGRGHIGRDAMSVTASHDAMVHAIRNLGRPEMSSTAIAAVDIALWDLKARLLDVPRSPC